MLRLITSYYKDPNINRDNELQKCFDINIKSGIFDEIILVCDVPFLLPFESTKGLEQIIIKNRPSFSTLFEIINQRTKPTDWNVIANSDIYFDESIKKISNYNERTFVALTRYDIVKGQPIFLNRRDSQDVWCFKGKTNVNDANFRMGSPGCDNAIAYRFKANKYDVINPSMSIKTYHLHESGVRNYDSSNRVPQPYYLIQPTL